jgi:predicted PurR-regulated permease PerM
MDLLAGFLQAMSYLLVPLIVYYLLAEGPELLVIIDGLIPPRYRERTRQLMGAIHLRLGGYIRGQIAVVLAMAILQSIAFQMVGVPYAWLLGLIAGVSNVVPYSPYLTSLAPALLVAGLSGADWGRLLLIVLVFTGVQKAETLYFTPVWVGRASKLHPLEVLVAILCFGFTFGIVGLILAIPMMVVVKVVLEMLIVDYKRHPWFDEAPWESVPEGEP